VGEISDPQHAEVGRREAKDQPAEHQVDDLLGADEPELLDMPPTDQQDTEQPVQDSGKAHQAALGTDIAHIVIGDNELEQRTGIRQQQEQTGGAERPEAILDGRPEEEHPVDVEGGVQRPAVQQGGGHRPPPLAVPDGREDAELVGGRQGASHAGVDEGYQFQRSGHGGQRQGYRRAVEIDLREKRSHANSLLTGRRVLRLRKKMLGAPPPRVPQTA